LWAQDIKRKQLTLKLGAKFGTGDAKSESSRGVISLKARLSISRELREPPTLGLIVNPYYSKLNITCQPPRQTFQCSGTGIKNQLKAGFLLKSSVDLSFLLALF